MTLQPTASRLRQMFIGLQRDSISRSGVQTIDKPLYPSRQRLFALAWLNIALVVAAQSTAHAQAEAQPGRQAGATPSGAAASTAVPSVDQILERYAKAIGGREAWNKFTSRTTMGTIEVPSMNLTGIVMLHEKAPSRSLATVVINGAAFRKGFDGKAGWTDDPKNGLRDETGAELAETRRDADFFRAFDLRRQYTKLTVTGKEKIGELDAYVVEATVPEGGAPTKMFFDAQSGLLLRTVSENHDADGVTQFSEDYEDYREVDGIKIPFTSRQTNGDTTYTMTISEVHHNVELEDSEFAKPAAQ